MYTLKENIDNLIEFAKANIDNPNAVFPEDVGKNSVELKKLLLKGAIEIDYDSLIQDEIDIGVENDSAENADEAEEVRDNAETVIDRANDDITVAKDALEKIAADIDDVKDSVKTRFELSDNSDDADFVNDQLDNIKSNAEEANGSIDADHALDDD